MNKEQIIYDMCMSYRHDYGLRKEATDPSWTAGMTEQDAIMLYKTMEQIYNNNIEPLLKEFNDLKEGKSVQVPQSKEHAALMLKLAQMYLGEDK
jgi:hypothetical protein